MKALITGGTGFVGRHLVELLDHPVVLGRNPDRIRQSLPNVIPYPWQADRLIAQDAFAGVNAVFHLAGESVFRGRWNAAKKERIMNSRVQGTRTLVDSLARLESRPEVLVCASAIGFYGSQGDNILDETSAAGDDFLARVCVAWEKEARRAQELGMRVVNIRTGIVLGRDGGALPQMLTPFKLGLGGWLGNGKQYMSWIHIEDLVRIMIFAASEKKIVGPLNAVSPHPLTNRDFTRILSSVLHRPAFLPVPSCMLQLILGEFSTVILGSQRVLPERLQAAGFSYTQPELPEALRQTVR